MSHGIAISSEGGGDRLAPQDYTHKLHTTGAFQLPAPGSSVWVPVAGVQPTDEWLIVVGGRGLPNPGWGGFTVTSFTWHHLNGQSTAYAVYKR